jgi:hypothetical protein
MDMALLPGYGPGEITMSSTNSYLDITIVLKLVRRHLQEYRYFIIFSTSGL